MTTPRVLRRSTRLQRIHAVSLTPRNKRRRPSSSVTHESKADVPDFPTPEEVNRITDTLLDVHSLLNGPIMLPSLPSSPDPRLLVDLPVLPLPSLSTLPIEAAPVVDSLPPTPYLSISSSASSVTSNPVTELSGTTVAASDTMKVGTTRPLDLAHLTSSNTDGEWSLAEEPGETSPIHASTAPSPCWSDDAAASYGICGKVVTRLSDNEPVGVARQVVEKECDSRRMEELNLQLTKTEERLQYYRDLSRDQADTLRRLNQRIDADSKVIDEYMKTTTSDKKQMEKQALEIEQLRNRCATLERHREEDRHKIHRWMKEADEEKKNYQLALRDATQWYERFIDIQRKYEDVMSRSGGHFYTSRSDPITYHPSSSTHVTEYY